MPPPLDNVLAVAATAKPRGSMPHPHISAPTWLIVALLTLAVQILLLPEVLRASPCGHWSKMSWFAPLAGRWVCLTCTRISTHSPATQRCCAAVQSTRQQLRSTGPGTHSGVYSTGSPPNSPATSTIAWYSPATCSSYVTLYLPLPSSSMRAGTTWEKHLRLSTSAGASHGNNHSASVPPAEGRREIKVRVRG